MGRDGDRQRMVDALCAPELAPIVDLVVWVEEDEPYGANHLGTVRFRYGGPAELVSGTNPIGSEDPLAFLPYDARAGQPLSAHLDARTPIPLAWQRLRSFFADPDRSPDLAIVHTPRHFFPDEGGHVGEHGSLDVIQSRAPLILSGAGIPQRGYVDAHARPGRRRTHARLPRRRAGDGPGRRGRARAGRSGAARAPRAGWHPPPRDRDALGRRPLRRSAAPRRRPASCRAWRG